MKIVSDNFRANTSATTKFLYYWYQRKLYNLFKLYNQKLQLLLRYKSEILSRMGVW